MTKFGRTFLSLVIALSIIWLVPHGPAWYMGIGFLVVLFTINVFLEVKTINYELYKKANLWVMLPRIWLGWPLSVILYIETIIEVAKNGQEK